MTIPALAPSAPRPSAPRPAARPLPDQPAGRRRFHPGLRLRLGLGAVALALLAMVAAGIAAYGLTRTQSHAAEAMAAQRRIEAYGTLSVRVNEWMLGWLSAPEDAPPPDTRPVLTALDQIDQLVARDVAAARSATEAAQRARQSVTPARLRGLFNQLDQAWRAAPPDSPAGRAALAFHATQAPMVLSAQIEQEMRRRDVALAAMDRLGGPLLGAAAAIALAAPLVLAALYLMVLRPLFRRLSQASRQAQRLAMGHLPPGAGGHDELGLMFARLRQMAARIDRRQAGLEQTIASRTAALSAANDRLARIDSTRRRFFADVGHELRTPLTVIMGEAELGAAHPDAETRAAFQTVRARAERLFRRIEDILRIARSESGQLELGREPVDLAECTAAALADLAPVLRRAGITARIDLPPGLVVAGDADWLRQVLAGLFDNAAKYAGRGASVTVTGAAAEGIARLWLADTGPGLPAGAEARIFDRFARAEGLTGSAGTGSSGFGVGLALARWVVEALDGRLVLAAPPGDAEGRGTAGSGLALEMTLPLWRAG